MANWVDILSVLALWEKLLLTFAGIGFIVLVMILMLSFCFDARIPKEEIEMLDRSEDYD